MVFALIEVALGIALLTYAADEFVEGAVNVASAARVSPILVGAVIVGFGTSAPELLVSGIAAVNGDLELGLGNIIGSNVANLTLVLGAAALIVRLTVSRPVLIREAPLSLLAVLLFAYFTTNGLARWEGVVLLAALAASLTWVVAGGLGASRLVVGRAGSGPTPGRTGGTAPVGPLVRRPGVGPEPDPNGRAEPAGPAAASWAPGIDLRGGEPDATEVFDGERHTLGGQLIRTLLGLIGTVLGAQLLVWGATAIAADFGLSGGFVGFTLVAVGTSLPELVTAIMAARKGATELILGNLLGSNLFNSLAVGGAIAVVGPGPIDDEGLRGVGVIVMVVVAVGAWFAMATLRRVHRYEAILLLSTWLVAVVLLARTATESAGRLLTSVF